MPYPSNGHNNTSESSQVLCIPHWWLQATREGNVDVEAIPITFAHLPEMKISIENGSDGKIGCVWKTALKNHVYFFKRITLVSLSSCPFPLPTACSLPLWVLQCQGKSSHHHSGAWRYRGRDGHRRTWIACHCRDERPVGQKGMCYISPSKNSLKFISEIKFFSICFI